MNIHNLIKIKLESIFNKIVIINDKNIDNVGTNNWNVNIYSLFPCFINFDAKIELIEYLVAIIKYMWCYQLKVFMKNVLIYKY